MTPKEKAKELYNEFYIPSLRFATTKEGSDWRHRTSKKYATMVVDEKLNALGKSLINADIEWLEQVRKEIEKL